MTPQKIVLVVLAVCLGIVALLVSCLGIVFVIGLITYTNFLSQHGL